VDLPVRANEQKSSIASDSVGGLSILGVHQTRVLGSPLVITHLGCQVQGQSESRWKKNVSRLEGWREWSPLQPKVQGTPGAWKMSLGAVLKMQQLAPNSLCFSPAKKPKKPTL
jgi:hypothetical protein